MFILFRSKITHIFFIISCMIVSGVHASSEYYLKSVIRTQYIQKNNLGAFVDDLEKKFDAGNPSNKVLFRPRLEKVLYYGASKCGVDITILKCCIYNMYTDIPGSDLIAYFERLVELSKDDFCVECEKFRSPKLCDGQRVALGRVEGAAAAQSVPAPAVATDSENGELTLLINSFEKKGVSIDLLQNQIYLLKIIFENIKKVYKDIDIDKLIVHTLKDMMVHSKCTSIPDELKPYWNYIIAEEVPLEGVPVYQCFDQKEVFHLGNCNIVPIDTILEKMSALRKSISYKKEECAGNVFALVDMNIEQDVIEVLKRVIKSYGKKDRVESCVSGNAFLSLFNNESLIKYFLLETNSWLTIGDLGKLNAQWGKVYRGYDTPVNGITDEELLQESIIFYIIKKMSQAGLIDCKNKKGKTISRINNVESYYQALLGVDPTMAEDFPAHVRFLSACIKKTIITDKEWRCNRGALYMLLLLVASSSSVSLLSEHSHHCHLSQDIYNFSGEKYVAWTEVVEKGIISPHLRHILKNEYFVSSLLTSIGLGSEADRTSFLTELYPPVVAPVKTKKQIEEEKAQAKAERQRAHKRMLKMAVLETVAGQNSEADQGEKVDMLEHVAAAAEGEKEQLEFKKRNEEWFLHCKMPALSRVKACMEPEEKTAYVVKKDTVDQAKLIQEKEEIKTRQAAAAKRRIEARKKRRIEAQEKRLALAAFWRPIMVRLVKDYNYFHNKVRYEGRIVTTACEEKPADKKIDPKRKQMSARSLKQEETNCDSGVVTTPDGAAAAASSSECASSLVGGEFEVASAASVVPVQRVREQEQVTVVLPLPVFVEVVAETAPGRDYYQGSLQQCLTLGMLARHMKEMLAKEDELRNIMVREEAEARTSLMIVRKFVQHNPYKPCFKKN